MAGVWPDPIATPIKTAGLEDDAAVLTGPSGGRQSLEDNMAVLSSILNAVDAGQTVITSGNSGTYMQTTNTTGAVANEICRLDTAGKPIKSNTTIATSVLNNNTTVPTGAGVVAAIAAIPANAETITNNGGSNAEWHIAFPGGFILKCGISPNASSGIVDINFVSAFPTSLFAAGATSVRINNTGGISSAVAFALDPTRFRLYCSVSNGDNIHWWAFGR